MTQSLVLEAALASHLSPDGADRMEAALARRLDRAAKRDPAFVDVVRRHLRYPQHLVG